MLHLQPVMSQSQEATVFHFKCKGAPGGENNELPEDWCRYGV